MKKLTKLALASAVAISTFAPAHAMSAKVKGVLSAVISTPIGFFMSAERGAVSKGVEYADSLSAHWNDGFIGSLFGVPIGLFGGGIAGGVTGMIKGVKNGITDGYDKPFSAEGISLSGDYIDYEPYDI